jgi:hypothetical protein
MRLVPPATPRHETRRWPVQTFGKDVDYAMLVKLYRLGPNEGRFSPPKVLSEEVRVIQGDPDPERISTRYVERQTRRCEWGCAASPA